MLDGLFNRKFQGMYNGMFNRMGSFTKASTECFKLNLTGTFMRSLNGTLMGSLMVTWIRSSAGRSTRTFMVKVEHEEGR